LRGGHADLGEDKLPTHSLTCYKLLHKLLHTHTTSSACLAWRTHGPRRRQSAYTSLSLATSCCTNYYIHTLRRARVLRGGHADLGEDKLPILSLTRAEPCYYRKPAYVENIVIPQSILPGACFVPAQELTSTSRVPDLRWKASIRTALKDALLHVCAQ